MSKSVESLSKTCSIVTHVARSSTLTFGSLAFVLSDTTKFNNFCTFGLAFSQFCVFDARGRPLSA